MSSGTRYLPVRACSALASVMSKCASGASGGIALAACLCGNPVALCADAMASDAVRSVSQDPYAVDGMEAAAPALALRKARPVPWQTSNKIGP